MQNKKIKGATTSFYNNIKFKSKLEETVYKVLVEEKFQVQYEAMKFVIWEGFKPKVLFYNKDKATKLLKLDMGKLRDITYTPDFTFVYKNVLVIIEVKGFENDTFPIKKKLFRKLLEEYCSQQSKKAIYFEIYTKKQMLQAVKIIKDL